MSKGKLSRFVGSVKREPREAVVLIGVFSLVLWHLFEFRRIIFKKAP
jgi:hypothetical protein